MNGERWVDGLIVRSIRLVYFVDVEGSGWYEKELRDLRVVTEESILVSRGSGSKRNGLSGEEGILL